MGKIKIPISLRRLGVNLGRWFGKNAPGIMQGLGIAGMLSTTVVAVVKTPEALRLIEEKTKEKGAKLTIGEKIKVAGKCYIPALITGSTSTLLLILASRESSKRSAALATAYSLSETAFREYREKVAEVFGEEGERTVKEVLIQDKMDSVPAPNIVVSDPDEFEAYEPVSGRYFSTSQNKLDAAVNEVNRRILSDPFDGFQSQNDFFELVGLPRTEGFNDKVGWFLGNLLELQNDPYPWGDHNGSPVLLVVYQNAATLRRDHGV